jgi:flagellar biosynthetic protein FliR
MIELSVARFGELLATLGFPFVRVLAFIATEPVLGNRTIPARVKVLLALLVAMVVAPTIGPMPKIDPASAAGLLVIAQQILIGVSMGFVARIVVAAAEMAGQLSGLQVGLGFAVFFDPQGSGQTPVVAQFYGLIAILTLLAADGHHVMLTALVQSFQTLPIDSSPVAAAGLRVVVEWAGEIFRAGLMLSMPVVGALLVANVSMGVLTRAAPQLNIFAVGFPVTLGLGFLMLYLSLPLIVPAIEAISQESTVVMIRVLERMRPVP